MINEISIKFSILFTEKKIESSQDVTTTPTKYRKSVLPRALTTSDFLPETTYSLKNQSKFST